MKRRNFLKTTSCTIAGMSLGDPLLSAGEKKYIKLGMDCYSLRSFRWKAPELLDYAAKTGMDYIQANLVDFESTDEAYLIKVREHARRVEVEIEPGINSICSLSEVYNPKQQGPIKDYMLLGIRIARTLGSKAIKCFLGNSSDRRGTVSIPAKIEDTIKNLKSVRSQALDAGVKFAVETHGDVLAREAKIIIEEAGPDFVGCCLDTGNSVALCQDPLMTLEILGPYTVTTHIRDSVVYEHPRGAEYQTVVMGDGCIDYHAFVKLFAELCPDAPFLLENITGGTPNVLPYLEPDYWKTSPDMPAADFARFLKIVKDGYPFTGSMMISRGTNQPPEYAAALKEQQRFDLDRGIEYCKKTLDLGIRWRQG